MHNCDNQRNFITPYKGCNAVKYFIYKILYNIGFYYWNILMILTVMFIYYFNSIKMWNKIF